MPSLWSSLVRTRESRGARVRRGLIRIARGRIAVASLALALASLLLFRSPADAGGPKPPTIDAASTVDPEATGLGDIARIVSGSLDAVNVGDDLAYMTTTAGAELGALLNAPGGGDFSAAPNMPAPLSAGAQNPLAIALGNFDNVGTPDLFLAHNTSGADASVSVYGHRAAQDGNLSGLLFGPAALGANNPVAVAAGDFTNDGLDEVVTANNLSGNITIALNDGAGHFYTPASSQVIGGLLGPVAVATADFDGTGVGQTDIAVVNGTNLQVLLNSGVIAPPAVTPIPNSPETLAVADLDGINGPDIVVGATLVPEVRVFFNDGTGQFAESLQGAITVAATGPITILDIETGDFDGVGNADIALLLSNDSIVVLENDSRYPGEFVLTEPLPLFGSGAVDMTVCEFDAGAGFQDLAVAETGAGGQIEVVQVFGISGNRKLGVKGSSGNRGQGPNK